MTAPSDSPHRESLCGVKGGMGIGAGHVCICIRKAGHPCDTSRPHACDCGALWAEPVPDDVPVGVLDGTSIEHHAEIRARVEREEQGGTLSYREDWWWLLDEVERLRGWEAVADALAKHLEELRNRCEPETVFGSLVTYLGTKAQQV